jgi:hypothetical protein
MVRVRFDRGPPVRYRTCSKHRPEGEAEAATAKANVRR